MADELTTSAGDALGGAGRWRGRRARFGVFLRSLLRRQVIGAGIIAAFLVVLAVLVLLLLPRPVQTPLIAITTGVYEWPFPPNAWAVEDLAAFRELDEIAIQTRTISTDEQSRLSAARGAVIDERELERALAVICYVQAHGIAQQGVPYLVPEKAALDGKTWMKLDDLLESISKLYSDKPTLLVLDCNRLQENWHLGLLEHDFPAAVEAWWKTQSQRYPNIAILCSAAPGERAWTSEALGGSVFGHFFRLGLAGHAKQKRSSWGFIFPERVTCRELADYLNQHVSDWVRRNYGETQSPMLLTHPNVADFDLVFPLRDFERLAANRSPSAGASVSRDARMELWETLARSREHELHRFEPVGWRELEHKLLWLDQLSRAGSQYQPAARRLASQLEDALAGLEQKLHQGGERRSVRQYSGVIAGAESQIPPGLRLRSVPLAEYFGSLTAVQAGAGRDALAELARNPTAERLRRALHDLDREGLRGFVEHQFLLMLQRYQWEALWQQPAVVAKLLDLRDRCEALAAVRQVGRLGDERVHHWVRALVEEADRARRAVEDRLFVEGAPEIERLLKDADEALQRAEVAASELYAAMRLRDRVWSEYAYLAQWFSNPQGAMLSDSVEEDLLRLAADTRRLEQVLTGHAGNDTASVLAGISQINQLKASVELALEALSETLETVCGELVDSQRVGAIEAVLAVPTISFEKRDELELRLIQLQSADRPAHSPEESSEDLESRVSQHPLIALLSAEPASDSARWNQQWQEAVKAVGDELSGLDDRSPRENWIAVEQRLRAIAPIHFQFAESKNEFELEAPIRTIQGFDLHALLRWQARRSVDDFWGAAGEAGPHFFYSAARDYLQSAAELAGVYRLPVDEQLAARLDHLREAAREWLSASAENVVLLEAGDDAETRIGVTDARRDPLLPSGTAAILLRRDGQRVSGTRFNSIGAVELPLEPTTLGAALAPPSPLAAAERLDALAVFRGHEFAAPFTIEPLRGVVVEHEPHEYEPARVVLHSPWKQVAVVLVLDCSNSMEQVLEGDKTRLAVGKAAIQELLSSLGSQRGVRVGVRLFGHRVGWSTDRPVRVLTSPTYAGTIPQDLTPDSDVERVLPLSDFDFAAAQAAFRALDGVRQGWGQSPLYLALERALIEDFADEDDETLQHIIVITDGRNYQARPTAAERKTLSSVLQAWRQRRVPIHILGLGMDAGERREASADFARLANDTGGSYHVVDDSFEVRQALRDILQRDSYSLARADGTTVDEAELGMPLSDTSSAAGGDWYALRYGDIEEPIWLEGGEEIGFRIRPDRAALEAFPYDQDVAAAVLLRSSGSSFSEQQMLRVHRPLRDSGDVHFLLSLQRYAGGSITTNGRIWQWTARPREAWIEIAPAGADAAAAPPSSGQSIGQRYVFYDASYQPGKPVPELHLLAQDWPAGVRHARVRAWFKPGSTAPRIVIGLSDVVDGGAGRRPEVVADVDDVRVRLDGRLVEDPEDPATQWYRVRAVERHARRPANVEWLKVMSPSAGELRPTRIVRQFDERHGIAVHWFYYADPDEALLAQLRAAHIGIATRDAALADAIGGEEVVVEISEAGKLLPLAGSWLPAE